MNIQLTVGLKSIERDTILARKQISSVEMLTYTYISVVIS